MLFVIGILLVVAACSASPAGHAAAAIATSVTETFSSINSDTSTLPSLKSIKTYRAGRESTSSLVRPFPFLQVVRFSNDECTAETGFAGTCYTESECLELKGMPREECADGYGRCCRMTYTCRETMHHNVSYFVPPTFPSGEDKANVCPLKIAFDPDICQIRLDLIKFDILGPREGDCIDDMFVVTGGNANHRLPVICGENTGQHMYINVDTMQSPVELQMITGIENYVRDWRIKVTMIPCASQHRAPLGCLQYQTGITGHVRSFNFNQRNETRLGYLNGADYAICFRRERDMCSVTYSVRTEPDDVELTPDSNDTTPYGAPEATLKAVREPSMKVPAFGIATSDGKTLDFQAVANVGASKCTGDYLAIPGLDRFCGGAFNQASGSRESQSITVKNAGPLMILFKSDKAFNGRGFNINFQQGPCTPLLTQTFF